MPPRGGGGLISDGKGGMIVSKGDEPVVEALVGLPIDPDSGEGARAAAVAGAMLGVLAAVSSAMWALYKFKPGLIQGGGGGRRGWS